MHTHRPRNSKTRTLLTRKSLSACDWFTSESILVCMHAYVVCVCVFCVCVCVCVATSRWLHVTSELTLVCMHAYVVCVCVCVWGGVCGDKLLVACHK